MTPEQRQDLARRLATHEVAADMSLEFEGLAIEDRREVLALACRLIWRERLQGQPRALRLLRSWLNPEQRRQLRNRNGFRVTGSAGGEYRLWPDQSKCERVEKHGRRWFARGFWFCLHDEDQELPPADVTLAHLLWLQADEPGFLAVANAHESSSTMWNSEWLRRLAAGRRTPEGRANHESMRARRAQRLAQRRAA